MTRDDILAKMREQAHYPATARDLARILKVPREQRATFTRHLKSLLADGALVQVRGNRLGLPEKMDLMVGRLQVNPSGFGFVAPERKGDAEAHPDIYIPAFALAEAMNGDTVVVRVEKQTEKGFEGRLVKILQRAHERIVGRFDVDGSGLGYVVPFDRRLVADVQIPTGEASSAEPGDMVVVTVSRWPTATRGAAGTVSEVLSGASTSPALTRRSSSASTAFRTRTRPRRWPRPRRSGARCASRTSRAAATSAP